MGRATSHAVTVPTGDFDTDVLIVGSGFGGAVAALRLTEKGYRVWVLEKGRRWQAEQFPRSNWNLPKSFWMPWLGWYGTWGFHLLRDVMILYGVGVGGGSLVYANTHMEPRELVWSDPRWKDVTDWRRVMPAHYATARRMLGSVASPRFDEGDEALRRVAERRGLAKTFYPTKVGVYLGEPGVEAPDPYFGGEGPRRVGCTFCGGCMVGCPTGAKNTLDRNYLYLAEKKGARILPETQAELVEPLPGGGFRVVWRASTERLFPRRGAFTARRVVLAAGVLGTTKLLMDCRTRGTLVRLSPRLGEYVRTNSEALLGITSRSNDELWRGLAIQAEVHVDERTRMELVRFPKGSDVVLALGTILTDGGGRIPRWLRWVGQLVAHPIQSLRLAWPLGKAARSQVLLVMQTVDNYTTLRQRRPLYWPFRRTLTSQPPHGQGRVPSYLPIANQVARELAQEMDAIPQSSLVEVLLNRSITAHILGGCAVAGSPDEGVIDASFQVFGYPGLYVMDGSVVGVNLGANPSLTITALAEYACAQFPPAGEVRR